MDQRRSNEVTLILQMMSFGTPGVQGTGTPGVQGTSTLAESGDKKILCTAYP